MEQRALRRLSVAGIAVLLLAGVLLARAWRSDNVPAPRAGAPDASANPAERIKVEVLNATEVRGLARRATQHLRDRGFDVLYMGTATAQLDSTLVLDRSGNPDRARRVAEALGGARVESRPDSSRYLDVTVMLGRSWRAPTEPFYP
jgi:LytR cell envelope-related transcriptional attenuator